MKTMSRRPIAKAPIFAGALAIIVGGTAWGSALVGETRSVPLDHVPLTSFETSKTQYRRPETIPFPASNPYTMEKAILGRMLYYDPRLSANGAVACVSCHNPGFGHADGVAKSIGQRMRSMTRKSSGVANTAWGQSFMWDGRAVSLEEQALMPIQSETEMNEPLDGLIHILAGLPGYKVLFVEAFPNRLLSTETVADAIATYERTIVSAVAPFDRWIEGDASALSDAAVRGFDLFTTKAGCASCHGGWRFTDDGFHDIGLPDDDEGRGRYLPQVEKMRHAFKTPSLREATLRGPYMHDGSLPTLESVVAHYNQGGVQRPSQSELVVPLGLSAEEQADIVAFLRTLTGPISSNFVPALPR
jgi:cytochrome c peroxidase